MAETSLTLEFTGGSEFLVGNQKIHQVSIPSSSLTIRSVLNWLRETLLKDCDRIDLLLEGEYVRPGVLVLVNDTDWELMDEERTELKSGDRVTFISTLHGG
ncbi:hypothetical protein PFISCL1PPCAC_24434 [Pristionchus fissidentatus]|uniref:Ubiquitin-related modifier 1 homolog n=1 Tax=Pristionchus fissidentatus TaxID=1538716 RepID=A0AAV5WQ16_9BILA|nr:hypothetical protein PFISCL1PPCAC_24434 [Pristionchus fissidentatus]